MKKRSYTRLFTPQQAKEMEDAARKKGATSLELIQNAVIGIKERVRVYLEEKGGKTLIVCGKGGNGADGLALQLLLAKEEIEADALSVNTGKQSEENALLFSQVATIDAPKSFSGYTLIVDALYGGGFRGEMPEECKKTVEKINASGAYVIAVDLPSGVEGATGKVNGCAVRANETVCTTAYKVGAFVYPGAEFCGDKVTLSADLSAGYKSKIVINEPFPLPERSRRANKGDCGKIAVIAGSKNMAGAAFLAARAAYTTGAGLVKIITPEENRVILQTLLPEAVLFTYDEKTPQKEILASLDGYDAAVLGPGLGRSENSRRIVSLILQNCALPLVLDADGLNLTVGTELVRNYRGKAVLTPHFGEAARLLGEPVGALSSDPLSALLRLREKYGCTVILKDAHTLVGCEKAVFVNTTGSNGMAVGGCGDVLSGIVGTLLGQKMPIEEAAATAVFLHGEAGFLASKKHGNRSMTASHVIDGLEEILLKLDKNN